MIFAHDTTVALLLAADLVNSDELTDVAAVETFLDKHQVEPRRPATAADLDAVLALRPRLREADRLRRCEAPGCEAVFVDLSKNRSRRYCDTGNCGNRQHVAAYRQRRYRDRLAARDADREPVRDTEREEARRGA